MLEPSTREVIQRLKNCQSQIVLEDRVRDPQFRHIQSTTSLFSSPSG